MSGKVLEIVLKMSLIGCYSFIIVLLVRFLILKLLRAPRKYACYLWMAVFLNLCLPFSVRGPVSLIPQDVGMFFEGSARMEEEEVSPETAPADGEMAVQLPVDAGALPQAGSTPSGEWPGAGQIQGADGESQQETDENAGQETGTEARVSARERAAFLIWLGGAACVLGYQGLTALRFRRRLSRLRCVKESKRRRLRVLEGLPGPFLWGVFRPVICLPAGLEEKERRYILEHEECHRKRRDPLVKCLILLVCSFHWFNPAAWLACVLCSRDMEIACDEAVLAAAGMTGRERKVYAASLLKYAARQNRYFFAPPAFGEPPVKSRIKNILRYRKRPVLVSVAAAVLVLAAAAGLVLRPGESPDSLEGQSEPPQAGDGSQESGHAGQEDAGDMQVLNNGGSVIQVKGQLYYADGGQLYAPAGSWDSALSVNGQALYSDGSYLYLSSPDQNGFYDLYRYQLDGNGFRKLAGGRIADCSADGESLYYLPGASGEKGLWRYDTVLERSTLLAPEAEMYLGQYQDALYTARQQEDGLVVDEILQTETGIQIRENLLGEMVLGTEAASFYADDRWIVLAAGSREGSLSVLSGDFYSFDRQSGELIRRHLTDAAGFAAFGGYLYYEKYENEGGASQRLYRTDPGLSAEEEIGQALRFVAGDGESGRLLASSGTELISLLPDGTGRQSLSDAAEFLEGASQMEENDEISYTDANVVGRRLYVRVQLWGWREGQNTGWRNEVLEEAWICVDLKSGDSSLWEPELPDAPEEASQEPTVNQGVPAVPEENGWDVASAVDLTAEPYSHNGDGNLSVDAYRELADGTGALTCLLGETESYRLYGKSDFQSMLFEHEGNYAQLTYPYLSSYLSLPDILEGDFDGDGEEELAVILEVKHGTGLYINSLFVADTAEDGEVYVHEFAEEDFTGQLSSHLSYRRTEEGVVPLLDGEPAFGTLENRDGMIFGSVGLGSQMRIRFEDGKILLTGELELWEENPARVTPEFSGEKMEAEIEYQDGGGFSLTGVKAADVP